MKKIIIPLLFILCACGAGQQPTTEQPTYQIVDNSQTTIIVGDNNKAEAETTPTTSSEPSSVQETEEVTKSSVWIVWLVLLALLTGVGVLVYLRYFKKR